MPIVPRIDAPQVGAAQGPAIRFDAPQVQNYAPRQTMQLGQAAEAAGGELARIVAIRAIVPTRHTPPQNIVHLHSLTRPLFTAAESV